MGKKYKALPRCIVSNKVINGKEVVLTDYALDYVKMQGYVVVEKRRVLNKAIAVCIMFCMVALVVMIPSISAISSDFLNGDGSFDTPIQYSNWIKINSGGISIHETNIIYAGNGSLRNTITGSNAIMLSTTTHSLDSLIFNNNLYKLSLICDAKSGTGATSTTSCYRDEVKVLNEGNNTNLTFAWRKSYSYSSPSYNIMKVNLIYPNNETYTVWINDNLIFDVWFKETISLNDYITITIPEEKPTEKKSLFYFDFSQTINMIVAIFLFVASILAFMLGVYILSGSLLAIIGFAFLFSDINMLISTFLICLGIVIIFHKS